MPQNPPCIKIADFIANTIMLNKHGYTMIKDLYNTDIDLYHISQNHGNNTYLLVFFKSGQEYHSWFISRKDMLNNNLTSRSINKCNLRVPLEFYEGSIMEGTFTTNTHFCLDDVYLLNGKNIENILFMDRFTQLESLLLKIVPDHIISKTQLDLNPIEKGPIAKINIKSNSTGLTLRSKTNNTKLVLLLDKKNKYLLNANDDICVFRMQKTETPDVYHLHTIIFKQHKTTKIVYMEYKYHDIAYIPTLILSQFCSALYKSTGKQQVFVDCCYNKKKNKWIPQKHNTTAKWPDSESSVNDTKNKFRQTCPANC